MMIGTLRGTISVNDDEVLIIEVNGIGYIVNVPKNMKDELHTGDNIYLYTKLIVREDSLTLYGFHDKEGCELFDLLLGVNGVGPKVALSILSTLTPDIIRRAIFNEQLNIFGNVPGVGKKTAQKIFIHLQDRISTIKDLSPVAGYREIDSELLDALISLGYSVVEAQAAIQSLPREIPEDIEERLRLTLQYFAGR